MMANVRAVELIIEKGFLDKFHRLTEQRDALLAALEDVEWVRFELGMAKTCPWCRLAEPTRYVGTDGGYYPTGGHAPDCQRQAAIAKARGDA
jgi:hypothetical protein